MSRLVLVDAYNAIFALWPDPPEDRDEARDRLVARAEAAIAAGPLRSEVDRAHLVFDTRPGAYRAGLRGRAGRISWHYAKGSADAEILEHLRRHEGRRGPPRVVVATNDRELRGRARHLGARGIPIEAFFGRAPRHREGAPRPSPHAGPPLTPRDFGLPEGEIDLTDADDDLR